MALVQKIGQVSVTKSHRVGRGLACVLLGGLGFMACALALAQLPSGGSVRAGAASFASPAANRSVITQVSEKAIIDWRSFSIGAGHSVQFVQPSRSAVALNRVTGAEASRLEGTLSANGQVWLLNPHGILIGAGGQVNSAGFLGTTRALADGDFLAGRYRFSDTATPGSALINLGSITAANGGYAVLAGTEVRNEGLIQANLGSVVLGGAKSFVIDVVGDRLLSFQVTEAAQTSSMGASLVDNRGQLIADGGQVLLSARATKDVIAGVINTSGLVQANSAMLVDGVPTLGVVTLEAGAGTLINSGVVKAEGTQEARSGGSGDRGGTIRATGGNILNSGRLSADGAAGGGVINLGASERLVHSGAISANATAEGAGGRVLLIADLQNLASRLELSGKLSAEGGVRAGGGGFIETSASRVTVADGARVSTAAPGGRAGTWLIDPTDYTIAASGGDISGATLGSNLASGNVTIQSSAGSSGTSGAVNVNDAVSWSANKLTLNAQNDININSILSGSGTAQLALEYGQATPTNSANSTYVVRAPVNLPAGDNFFTKSGSSGTTNTWKVITALGAQGSTTGTDLQGIGTSSYLSGRYVLGANIDASSTSSWNNGAGFNPIGGISVFFSGSFDGLGHTISGLTVYRPTASGVGLFGYSSGTVSGVGLVGGSFTGNNLVGALVGDHSGSISDSYATATVSGAGNNIGGLVGQNSVSGSISESYATGAVSLGLNSTGGLVGYNNGTISNSYATGSVTGDSTGYYSGGLVGQNYGSISKSYATGAVGSVSFGVGGLVGYHYGGTVSDSYWDTETTGQSTSAAGTGKSTAAMKAAATFSDWSIATAGGSANTWLIYEGKTYPLLRDLLTPITVTASASTKTYDGTTAATGSGVSYSVSPGSILGTLAYSAGSANAGTTTLTPSGLYSTQSGYDISYASGVLTVNPAPLTVSGTSAADKVYDGTTVAVISVGSLSGFVGSETVTASASGLFDSANAGSRTASATYTLADGSYGGLAANYTLASTSNHAATISPAPLTASSVISTLIATLTPAPIVPIPLAETPPPAPAGVIAPTTLEDSGTPVSAVPAAQPTPVTATVTPETIPVAPIDVSSLSPEQLTIATPPAPALAETIPVINEPSVTGKPAALGTPTAPLSAPVSAPLSVVVSPPPSLVVGVKPPTPKDVADSTDRTLAIAAPPDRPKPAAQARRAAAAPVMVNMGLVKIQQALPAQLPAAALPQPRFSISPNRMAW